MNRNLLYIIVCLWFIFLSFSCKKNEIYYSFHELKSGKWSQFDTLFFEIDSTSIIIGKPIRFDIELVNNTDYPYRNIWLHVLDDFSDTVFVNNEIQYELCDEYGKWYGSGFGSLYQLSLNYKDDIVFKEKRNYRVGLIHGMRDEPLTGIEKVGIKLVASPD